ncbi:MAG: hypothetical protein A3B25_03085 [Candidatus Ryanbacteria bacterium RIFCSPLOWO2_01_FULL_48_26]|uniref:AAA domain-containing protein n=1 Tax=Candidatus Ryanbacteria bacterium RIFCSPLOWO2_01_FULL_48_26 TaxID=1802126 RepID=A0A1G2GX74_9BACT|nr:MAG: hypothetical protein A3B25_03085 [Candidatus Ryanbacteria bacterium RIFCSPLOWO2_01_FULL_48_26]
MARIIAIFNAKGGVGKTTTAVNVGAYLASLGKRALLVDFDPQANASSALGHASTAGAPSVYHGVIGQISADDLIKPSQLFNFHFIPSAPHLAGILIELVNIDGREQFLRKFLNSIRHKYDYILIDLPPSLSLLTVNGLVASDEVLIPVQAEYYSLEGIGQLLETIELIKNNLRHQIAVTGAFITMYDKREHLSREVAKNLRRHFPHRVFKTEVPRSVALAEAPSFSKPIMLHSPNSPGAIAYRQLTEEILSQEMAAAAAQSIVASPNFGNFNINME